MFRVIFLFNVILCVVVFAKKRHRTDDYEILDDEGTRLVTDLRNDVNLDLPMDEEYEDLRAELLAYHTALASLTQASQKNLIPGATNPNLHGSLVSSSRRSLKSTPCWAIGGICVHKMLCKSPRFLSQVPGCKNRLQVCCFTWNKAQARDLTDHGINNPSYPWQSNSLPFGGKGIIGPFEDSQDNVLKLFGDVPFIPVSLQSKASAHTKSANTRKGRKNKPIIMIIQDT